MRLTELSEDVRAFLDQARQGNGVTVEDETGQARYSIAPCHQPTVQERSEAMKRLQQLQQQTRRAMVERGVTEEEVDRLLQEDD
ncbi:MAG: hypothetical protein ACREJB_16325 [Planctomycetaceae bacterium]